ncbi:DegT/DnrJ/EryC1/StrS family aminotransferase [Alcanivorax sp.]|uniref:DegT/DnrJ/EryC1/StrS family aminotransferase n=1 Tax=Alcanivorax sp. TaxID=1872427 RepID=UPI00258CE7B6|nr:DegT/DnrJ/EryC1/StrS family aminotransferase [Alcanivorax sp.]
MPFNSPGRENAELRKGIDNAISGVLERGCYLGGDEVAAFEREFAEFCGSRHCVAVGNGTDALEIGLRALGVGVGDEVITVANAGGYTTTACALIGAVPVYVDVNPDNLLMDMTQAVQAVSEETRAIVITHLYGQTVDVMKLRRMLDEAGAYHVRILEDCAQAHGATVDGRTVGALGDISTFSFYPTKNLGALGDAGALVTSDDELADRCRRLRQYGWLSKYHSVEPLGRNSRMDEIQAAVLRVKLRRLPVLNWQRIKVAGELERMVSGVVDVMTPPANGSVAHLFVVAHEKRDEIRSLLAKHGIATDIHYPVLDPDQKSMRHILHRTVDLTHARRACGRIFSLPCYAGLDDKELEYIGKVFALHLIRFGRER